MILSSQLQESLHWLVELLDLWLPRSMYALGGGTALAARWRHRASIDIDLFADEREARRFHSADGWQEIAIRLHQRDSNGSISKLRFNLGGFSCVTPSGEVSFYSVPRVTKNPISDDIEVSTDIAVETNVEILFKKLRGRMVNSHSYVARDLYDVIVCYQLHKSALLDAMSYLDVHERNAIGYDVKTGDAEINDLATIRLPRYPQLVSNRSRFNRIAGEILSENVNRATDTFLNDILGQPYSITEPDQNSQVHTE